MFTKWDFDDSSTTETRERGSVSSVMVTFLRMDSQVFDRDISRYQNEQEAFTKIYNVKGQIQNLQLQVF